MRRFDGTGGIPGRWQAASQDSRVSYARKNWGLAVLIVMCAIVYRPWDAPHLPLTDFGIFLEARGTSHNFFSQYAGVASYYMAEGRACFITFLYMVLGGAAFGTWAPGWHWTYFALNSAVLVLAWNFLAKIGINRVTRFVVLGLWAVMGPTAELWYRPAGEAVALIFFIVALGQALNYSQADNWRRRATIIALCAAGIILSKEMLVVLLPAGWLFSRLNLREGSWSWAQWTRRDTYLLAAVTSVVLLLAIPVAYIASHAHKASYAGQYGISSIRWSSLFDRMELTLIPAAPRLHWLVALRSDPAWTLVRVLPNIAWIAMIVVTAIVARKGRRLWPVVFGLTWAMTGVLAYLPWPGQGAFYMMPFAAGTMFLAAHALNDPLSSRKHRRPVFLISSALILIAAVEARSTVNQHRLRASLNSHVIDEIARHRNTRVLLAAVPKPLEGTGGWANHLRGFGNVEKGITLREWRDLKCGDAAKALDSIPGAVVVSAAGGCERLDVHSITVTDSTVRMVWPYIWKPVKSQGRMYVTYRTDAHAHDISMVSGND
jgi:hypothetical protein